MTAIAEEPNPSAPPFRIVCEDTKTAARTAHLRTPHGVIETPTFMPVATQGTVKGLTGAQIEDLGARIILANAYHLSLRPGVETIEALGGLHRFMGWKGAILTDSGGYQIMSLAALRKIDEQGVVFRSHVDGAQVAVTPEAIVELQIRLGVDILMPLDECVPAKVDRSVAQAAAERTLRWAERSRAVPMPKDGRLLFGIVQGGILEDMRTWHATQLAALEFPGYAVGGLSVGEEREATRAVAATTAAALPRERPRYLMGVGLPQDLLRFIAMGYDMFDCVLPTRNGRNGTYFTSVGRVNIRRAEHTRANGPIDPACSCYVCRNFSRGYLRHLAVAGEMLAAQLATLHNVHFYLDLMAGARREIAAGTFDAWAQPRIAAMEAVAGGAGMIDVAWAQGAGASAAPGPLVSIAPLVMIGLVFYFLLLRPQQQKAKEHQLLLANLKKNDEIITAGGMYGRVITLADQIVTVEIAPNVRVRVSREQISSVVTAGRAEEKDKGKDKPQ